MIKLNQLLMIAPISLETKQELLKKLSSLSDEETASISIMCWDFIIQEYNMRLDGEKAKLLSQLPKAGDKSLADQAKLTEEKLLEELISRLDSVDNLEQRQEVREKLIQKISSNS